MSKYEGPAHPHVCGEHAVRVACTIVTNGSSPRVWGAPTLLVTAPSRFRLIPTCVGSTFLPLRRSRPASAHPHVCGEHTC